MLCDVQINSKKKSKKNSGLYFSGALTSFLTGITEPIEYMFLFVSPLLYVIHAFLDGLSFYFADILNIRIGNSFSGGLIDFLLFGVLQKNYKTNWCKLIPFGLIWSVIYFLTFSLYIKKFKVLVPGMKISDDKENKKEISKNKTLNDEALIIINALGNISNIESVEACATRLRISVSNNTIIDKQIIKSLGATAVFEVKGGIQIIFGGKSDLLAQEINQILNKNN